MNDFGAVDAHEAIGELFKKLHDENLRSYLMDTDSMFNTKCARKLDRVIMALMELNDEFNSCI